MPWQRPDIGSRVNREVHARFWERLGVQVPWATRHEHPSRLPRRHGLGNRITGNRCIAVKGRSVPKSSPEQVQRDLAIRSPRRRGRAVRLER
jgi:hypothetical protein